ncbi:MAG TPA: hypothetical protein VNT60_00460, partial [Deinococcales bacterium]|nr:hypothetical protein [Deinococcales bacterium]
AALASREYPRDRLKGPTTMTAAARSNNPSATAEAAVNPALRLAFTLSGLIVPLAALAAGLGVFLPGLYRDARVLVPVIQGQDLLTLLAMPVMLVVLQAARRGSSRARVVLLGLLCYVLYTYTGASMSYHWNALIFVYMALFALSAAAVAALAVGLDARRVAGAFSMGAPVLPVTAFLWFSAVFLAVPEVAQMVPFFRDGTFPDMMRRIGATSSFVFTLDLAVVTPLLVLSALWLARRAPWGFVLAGAMLVKAATMGLALLSMTLFGVLDGQPVEVFLTVVYALITAGGLGFGAWFFSHCRV